VKLFWIYFHRRRSSSGAGCRT